MVPLPKFDYRKTTKSTSMCKSKVDTANMYRVHDTTSKHVIKHSPGFKIGIKMLLLDST